jgi:hypothetical protein
MLMSVNGIDSYLLLAQIFEYCVISVSSFFFAIRLIILLNSSAAIVQVNSRSRILCGLLFCLFILFILGVSYKVLELCDSYSYVDILKFVSEWETKCLENGKFWFELKYDI